MSDVSKVDPHLVRVVRGDIARATGHRYLSLEKACENLPRTALQDLRRLIDNLKSEARSERQKRRRGQFWG